MIEILGYSFMQRALLAGLVVACVCGLIGGFLVPRRLSMIGEGLAHTALGGVAIGLFFGFYPLLAAVPFTLVAGVAIQLLIRRARVYGDAAIAIVFALGLSLGVILLSKAGGFNTDLFGYLFGSILTVSTTDLYVMLGLGALVVATVVLLYRPLMYVTFDPEGARASGLPVEALDTLLVVLTALTVVAAVQLVGIVMVAAMVVVPVAASMQVARSFHQLLTLSVLFAMVAVVLGLMGAYWLSLAAGGGP